MRALAALHALAGVCALANSLPLCFRLVLLLAVALSHCRTRWDYAWDLRVREVLFEPDGLVVVMRRSGPVAGYLVGSTVVTTFIVILHLRSIEGKFLAVPISRDSVDAEAFRRLRVGLRCGMWKPARDAADPDADSGPGG